ncbi:MAG: hypothetical protein LBC10_04635 [Deltaproteobacteria bacterium]|jgi:hypothetical protein|nr:hypothetical protein [Deltaproteobacteria bacterium]
MNTLARCALSVFVLPALAGCAQSPPQQVNMEEYLFQTAIDECRGKIRDMMPNAHPLARAAYFRNCMEKYGYAEKDYKYLWIDVLD